MNKKPSSRIPNFYNLSLEQRQLLLSEQSALTKKEMDSLTPRGGLTPELADPMIENVIGVHALPIGLALNFTINERDVIIPMVIEEPSVVAGASFMAKLARAGGGFTASSTAPEMIGQLQILEIADLEKAKKTILAKKSELLAQTAEIDPVLKRLGGGPRDLEVHTFKDTPIGDFLVVHIIYDVRDAMGANAVNTACEKIAPQLELLSGGRVHLRILSNLADRRMTKATCTIPLEQLAFGDFDAETVRDGIIAAWAFASVDPYRAATHNKGIMNGIDAVVIASGNDWRAVEAGAHAYAARNGSYGSLSKWSKDNDGNLFGELELPMAVGIVGGATKVHPTAQTAVRLMGVKTANELAQIIVSVGLAQNLAALRALATEGIQQGHMGLHARQVAVAAGATGKQINEISQQMVDEKIVRIDRAEELMKDWSSHD